MHNFRKVADDIYNIGSSDRKLNIFEGVYPLNNGVSYNSYVILDEKTALLDTVDMHCIKQFFENIEAVLNKRTLDYLIVQHMEPDHAALIGEIAKKYPDVKIVCSQKARTMILNFFNIKNKDNFVIIKENDTLNLGHHELVFAAAPMVHWPEVMVSYDKTSKILFSADAFGSFGALNGNMFDYETKIGEEYINEARRYYANIAGKYGLQAEMLLKKASSLDIKMICPLHGLILRDSIPMFLDKYIKWSKYEPEDNEVIIVYSSVYGGTENTVNVLAYKLAEKGVKNIKMYDTSVTHPSYITAEAFRVSHIVIASTTYNSGIFETMETFINSLISHNLKNRKYAVIQNGSWMPACGNQIKKMLEKLDGSVFINNEQLTVKSALNEQNVTELEKLRDNIVQSLNKQRSFL